MYSLLSLLLAASPTQLTLEVIPPEAIIFLDGKKLGDGRKPRTMPVKPGKHVVKVTFKGDSHEEEVQVKSEEKKKWQWTFEDDSKPMNTEEPATE